MNDDENIINDRKPSFEPGKLKVNIASGHTYVIVII